jgi:hypothetical protein
MHGERLCARLEFRGTEKTKPQHQSETGRMMTQTTDGAFSGVVWFDPESGRGIEVNSNHDFRVTRNSRVVTLPFPNPADTGPTLATTDHHHQVIAEKLVSVRGLVGSS